MIKQRGRGTKESPRNASASSHDVVLRRGVRAGRTWPSGGGRLPGAIFWPVTRLDSHNLLVQKVFRSRVTWPKPPPTWPPHLARWPPTGAVFRHSVGTTQGKGYHSR